MKLLPSDPDIQTIVSRIKSGDLNLQPDFQRGEVWSDSKKRRLIDSILRDWHVPPIHVIQLKDSRKQEVLDGQQRLVAIRDFVDGKIKVDGHIEPIDDDIFSANGCTYSTLPEELKRQFDQFTIRVFRLVDYKPEEPGDLFFRLNQPTSLTAAEQRNAFFGPVRGQIREMVEAFPRLGLAESFIGFSNSRMAFDDTIAKVCIAVEQGSLRGRITSNAITERYRSDRPLKHEHYEQVMDAISVLGKIAQETLIPTKFNKATLFTWLCFLLRLGKRPDICSTTEFFTMFEQQREASRRERLDLAAGPSALLLSLFNDRATARVSDASSVLARDLVISLFYVDLADDLSLAVPASLRKLPQLKRSENLVGNAEEFIDRILVELHWGSLP